MHVGKHASVRSTLALKTRADVTRSPKTAISGPTKRTRPKKTKKKTSLVLLISNGTPKTAIVTFFYCIESGYIDIIANFVFPHISSFLLYLHKEIKCEIRSQLDIQGSKLHRFC